MGCAAVSRIIQPDEIKVGDKIRIDRVIEGTVTRANLRGFVHVDHLSRGVSDTQGMVNTITLLEREVELPQKYGSVIRVTSGPGDNAVWMLHRDNGIGRYPTWISHMGSSLSTAELKKLISNGGYDVEVVL